MADVNQGAPAPETVTTATAADATQTNETADPAAAPAVNAADPKAAAADKKAAAAVKEEIRKLKLKIDGVDEELGEDEVIKLAQMGKAGQKRMQESAQLKKNIEAFIKTLQTDPMKVLADPGLNIPPEIRRQMAERIIQGEIEEMQKTPEQKEKEKLQNELAEMKKKYETEEKTRQEKEFQRLQEQAAVQYDQDITSALKDSGLPKTPYTVKKVAEVMMVALQNKIDVKPSEVIPLIRKQMTEDIREMFTATPDELIEEFLGTDNIAKLRKRSIAKLKTTATTPAAAKPTGQTETNAAKTEKVPPARTVDFWKTFGKF